MAIDVFQTRVLLAAVNARDENGKMLIDAPDEAFMRQHFGDPEPIESETFDIVRTTGSRKMAQLRAPGMAANVVRLGDEESVTTHKFPIIREKMNMTPKDLQAMISASNLYRSNPESLEARQNRIMATYLAGLKARAVRREKWFVFELLTKGVVQYKNGNTAIRVDFGIDSTFFPVLAGTSRWGQSAANIAHDLTAWTTLINRRTGGNGGRVILGTNAAELLLNDPVVMAKLNNLNYQAGRLVLSATSNEIGNYNGFTFERFAESYIDDAGDLQTFFPTNGVLMIGSTFRGRRPFGINEEFMENGQRPGDAYFSKSWIEPDPAVRWVLMACRPLPVVEEEGSWVFATVA